MADWKYLGKKTVQYGVPLALLAVGLYYNPHFHEYEAGSIAEGIANEITIDLSRISLGLGAGGTALNTFFDGTKTGRKIKEGEYEF